MQNGNKKPATKKSSATAVSYKPKSTVYKKAQKK